jgi:alkylmercury lyase
MATRSSDDEGAGTSSEPPDDERSDARRLVKSGFHALLDGSPPSVVELGRRTGLPVASVEHLIEVMVESGRAMVDGDRLVGIGGLGVVPTRHRLQLGRRTYYTWCAWDAIGIPAAFGRSALVETPCGSCGRDLQIRMKRGRAPRRRPERGWLPDVDSTEENPLRDFCPFASVFCSERHLSSWREADHTNGCHGRACNLVELADEGRRAWAEVVD